MTKCYFSLLFTIEASWSFLKLHSGNREASIKNNENNALFFTLGYLSSLDMLS